MTRWLIIILSSLVAFSAHAQQVIQSGKPIPGHSSKWITNGVIGDTGPANGGPAGTGLTELNITGHNNTSTPLATSFCMNDGPTTGPYHQLCFDPNAQGGGLVTYNPYGGASPLPLNCQVNGITATCFSSPGPTGPTGPPGQSLPNNVALKAFVPGSTATVTRAGFTTAGDGGAAVYNLSSSPCSLHGGNGDDGYQVKASNGNCWIADFSSFPANVMQWGAKADDSTDLGQFIQAAYNANIGTCVTIPAGIYRMTTSTLFTAKLPCFTGVGVNEAVDKATKSGTWIHIVSTGLFPFSISGTSGQGAVGAGFFKMGFYQDQPTIGGGWTPIVYEPIFSVSNLVGRIDFDNLNFYNSYACINVVNSARLRINNVMGQPLGTCLQFDQQHDVNFIDNIQFWPFWTTSGSDQANVFAYTSLNVDPIIFKRSDSPFIGRVFTLGYHSGINFASSSDGSTTGAQIDDLQVDAGKYGIWVTGNNTQIQVANFRHSGGTLVGGVAITGSEGYRDESNGSVASIGNVDCFFEGAGCVHLAGTFPGTIEIANSQMWNFNNDNNSSPAMLSADNGTIKLANMPGVVNPAHGGTLLPAVTTNAFYMMPGVSQAWTPTVAGTTAAGTPTYTTQLGSFWDDGAKVVLTFNVATNNTVGGATGNLAIKGLPRIRTGLTGQNGFCTIGSWAGPILDTGYTSLGGIIPGGAGVNQILLLESGGGVPTQTAPLSVFTANANMILEGECTFRWN